VGAHHRPADHAAAAERPAFDEAAHGYDQRQVDDYVAALWRYASAVTVRAANAEAALAGEHSFHRSTRFRPEPLDPGSRIGRMLRLAEEEAEDIRSAARRVAEHALEEAVDRAAAGNPIVREAREQADRLLLDAWEEADRRARRRERELEAQLRKAADTLESLRRQQAEVLSALLRLRGMIANEDIDRAVADLASAATTERDRQARSDLDDSDIIDAEVVEEDDTIR
jgi:hypothetical protein